MILIVNFPNNEIGVYEFRNYMVAHRWGAQFGCKFRIISEAAMKDVVGDQVRFIPSAW